MVYVRCYRSYVSLVLGTVARWLSSYDRYTSAIIATMSGLRVAIPCLSNALSATRASGMEIRTDGRRARSVGNKYQRIGESLTVVHLVA
jgi:hypothetical protein